MRLPLGVSTMRPTCAQCGAATLFAGRRSHPTRGLPWDVQTFVCTKCSAVTVWPPELTSNLAPTVPSWTDEYGAYTASLGGRVYRIVAYPRGSPLAGKYGCYCDGTYAGLTDGLVAAKTWCGTLASEREKKSP